jgi:nucleoside-diphosphate-sugar epimerase
MPNKTAFVTGGTGFIGLNLVEHLTQAGWDVVALHRPKSRLMYLQKYPVRLVEGAIEDATSLDRAMPEDVDAIFHVAGDVSLWSGHKQRQWRTNVEGTRNMVSTALAKRSRKFVHTSSTAVYGIPAKQSTKPRQNLARTVSITCTRRLWRRRKSQTGLRRDWMRSF